MSNDQDRRRRYRVAPPPALSLLTGVEADDGRSSKADLLDISAGGAGVLTVDDLGLALGDRVALKLYSDEVDLDLPATVVAELIVGDGARLGLQFDEEIQENLDLPLALREVLNRRRAVRVDPDGETDVILRSIGDEAGETQTVGTLLDISTTGVSVLLRDPPPFDSGDPGVVVSIALRDAPLDLVADVRAITSSMTGGFRCRLEFDPEATVGFAEQHAVLTKYVVSRLQTR